MQLVGKCKSFLPKRRTAFQVFNEEEDRASITTFSAELDCALGGGIHTGMITEVCGVPGVGKTQMCLQLSCGAQIPSIFGGLDAEVLYIDTEGGFVTDRVVDFVSATVKHCNYIASGENDNDIQTAVSTMTVEKLLAGIHVYSCHDSTQLLAVVNLLPDLLVQHPKVRLIIVDSVSFHFRHDFEDLSLRTRTITNLAQSLVSIARRSDIAVVVTNQMTTRVHRGSDKESYLVPCLGESWGHACTTRIILQFERENRLAWLYKSPSQPQTKVPYQITTDGVRDIMDNSKQHHHVIDSTLQNSDGNPTKRQKVN